MAAPCWAGQGLQEVTARVPRACVGRTTRREGGRRKASNSSLPNGCVWGQAQSGPGFRLEAKEPPWINELQGQLGIQLCQKHPLARAVSHVFGEISKVQGPGTRPGREPAAPSPLQGQRSTENTGSHPGCRGRVTPGCWPLAAFETFFLLIVKLIIIVGKKSVKNKRFASLSPEVAIIPLSFAPCRPCESGWTRLC